MAVTAPPVRQSAEAGAEESAEALVPQDEAEAESEDGAEHGVEEEAEAGGEEPDDEAEASREPKELVPCDICGRNFAVDRLQRHRVICVKQSSKKPRKMYGASAERLKLQEKAAKFAFANQLKAKDK